MRWCEKHPRMTKTEARNSLPPGACKYCVYWFRIAIESSPDFLYHRHPTCRRCGISVYDVSDRIRNYHRLKSVIESTEDWNKKLELIRR